MSWWTLNILWPRTPSCTRKHTYLSLSSVSTVENQTCMFVAGRHAGGGIFLHIPQPRPSKPPIFVIRIKTLFWLLFLDIKVLGWSPIVVVSLIHSETCCVYFSRFPQIFCYDLFSASLKVQTKAQFFVVCGCCSFPQFSVFTLSAPHFSCLCIFLVQFQL